MKKKHTKLHEWQQKANGLGGSCEKCGRKTDYLTVDHIVPVSFIEMLGLRNEAYEHDWNFQLLCRACNRLKGYYFDFTNPKTFPLLQKYVELTQEYYKL